MKRYLAELIGTFALVFCGTGAIIIDQQTNGGVTHVGIALTFGMIVMSMIYTFGSISGAHINPAVTIGFVILKKMKSKEVLPYLAAQLTGAVMASVFLHGLFPQNRDLGVTVPSGTNGQSFFLEIILSFFLMLVIIQVSTGSKEQGMFAGLAVGSVVALEALFAGPVTGASMNPARSLGPAIVSGNLSQVWIYILAPLAGVLLAVMISKFVNTKDPE